MKLSNRVKEEETYLLKVNREELDFIMERCSRKAARLEESHLEDTPCYKLSWDIMLKIMELKSSHK